MNRYYKGSELIINVCKKLKEKFKNFLNIQHKESIEQAIKSIALKENDLLIITGSLYLAGEALNLN